MNNSYYAELAKRNDLSHKLTKVETNNPELIWNARKMHYRLKNL